MKKVLSLILVLALAMMPILSLAAPNINVNADADFGGKDQFSAVTSTVVTIITYVGYAIAIVMVLWLGVQWILATPAKKAELKGKMWSMAIGIILLVGGVSIIKLVWGTGETFTQNLGN